MDGFLRSMTSGQEKLFPLRSKKFFTPENQNTKIFWYLKGNTSNFIVIGNMIWHVRFRQTLSHTCDNFSWLFIQWILIWSDAFTSINHCNSLKNGKRLGIQFQGLTQSICIQVLPVITGRTGKTLIINIVDLKMHKWITLLDVNELVPHWTFTSTSNNWWKTHESLTEKNCFAWNAWLHNIDQCKSCLILITS